MEKYIVRYSKPEHWIIKIGDTVVKPVGDVIFYGKIVEEEVMSESKLPPYNPDDVTITFAGTKIVVDNKELYHKINIDQEDIKYNVSWYEGNLSSDTKQHRDWCTWKMNPSIGNEDTFCNCDAGHKD